MFRNESSLILFDRISYSNSVTSLNISLSGVKVTRVPLLSELPISFTGAFGFPLLYDCSYSFPSLKTLATSNSDNAFTQETPTPCKPPETLYESLSNLPPAPIFVITTSSADTPSFLCNPTGIPLPLSSTVKLESLLISKDIEVQYPAIASSIELSTTS